MRGQCNEAVGASAYCVVKESSLVLVVLTRSKLLSRAGLAMLVNARDNQRPELPGRAQAFSCYRCRASAAPAMDSGA